MSEKKGNRRLEIYSFIKSYIQDKGYPPSVREICLGVGLKSTSTVHMHLENLEKDGLIKRDSTKPRTIEIMENSISKKK
jgi:repressor LexA